MATAFSASTLESTTYDIGRDLARRSEGLAPGLFNRRWWSNTLLQWSMKDEAFKVQLFRFIDVLPSLRDDAQVTRVAEEYFGQLPAATSAMQWGLRAAAATKFGARLSGASLRKQITQMATTFISGASAADAVPALATLWREG